jgi:interferon-induced GTP-binding protein Mx1
MSEPLAGYERYREFMDRLTENNVDEFISLPMIAVMGDTSSGKSSLLSNISLVELPSNDNLTTRCPIMLKMHHSANRSAKVNVYWKDKPSGKDVDFDEVVIGEENWHSITDAIADAQAHIISKTGKEVARDVVSVEIRGPHCQDLTLIDLPGIVRTSGKAESATLSEDIQGLMNEYLSNPRCIVLAVLPANVDFHNSQILAEARKVDPQTERTIPVLTKPDLIDDGAQAAVKELLLGKKTDSFEMGFHMVKGKLIRHLDTSVLSMILYSYLRLCWHQTILRIGRGQAALNKSESIEEGLRGEESFFNNTEPWRSIEDKNLLGTKHLRVKLAQLQMHIIRSSFKGIARDLNNQQEETMKEYDLLGEIPSSLTEKRSLFRSIKEHMWKSIGTTVLSGQIRSLNRDADMRPSAQFLDASQRFQDVLNSSKLATVSDVKAGTLVVVPTENNAAGEVCFIDNDKVYLENMVDEINVTNSSITSYRKNEPGNVFTYSPYVYIERKDGTIDQLKPLERKLVHPDPEWISILIKKNRPYKLPVFINTDVFEAIVAHLIEEEWAPPTMELLDFTAELMDTAADIFIRDIKSVKSFPALESCLVVKASEIVVSLKKVAKDKLEDFIKREKVPYTQNHYLFENLCKLRSERLMSEVLSSIGGQSGSGGNQVAIAPSALISTVKNVFQRNQERSVQDHMTEEMQNALDSYGKVALKRFIDNVPMLCIEIMQHFADEMNDVLSEISDDEINEMVKAPPGIVQKRDKLKRKAEVLKKGIEALGDLY